MFYIDTTSPIEIATVLLIQFLLSCIIFLFLLFMLCIFIFHHSCNACFFLSCRVSFSSCLYLLILPLPRRVSLFLRSTIYLFLFFYLFFFPLLLSFYQSSISILYSLFSTIPSSFLITTSPRLHRCFCFVSVSLILIHLLLPICLVSSSLDSSYPPTFVHSPNLFNCSTTYDYDNYITQTYQHILWNGDAVLQRVTVTNKDSSSSHPFISFFVSHLSFLSCLTKHLVTTTSNVETMDTECNFPELLALDLGTAESVFASKRMTAGPPRLPSMPTSSQPPSNTNGMGVIFESKSIQDLVEANILSTEDALAYTSARNFLSSTAFAQLQSHADAITRLTANPALGSISTHKDWDSDSNSVDSFELPSISLSRPAVSQHAREEFAHNSHSTSSARDEFLQPSRYGDSFPAASTSNRDSYGSFYDSYYNDPHQDDNDDCDSESVSSYGASVPAVRDRQQSVVTAATSVSSGCRHSTQSTQSRAMAPPSPVTAEHEKSEALARHVEFDLKQNMEHNVEQAPPSPKASPIPADIKESSWMSFEDDDEESFPAFTTKPSDLPPRPKTSSGSESRRQVPDFSEMAQWTFNKRRMSQIASTLDAATPERPSTASASIAPSVSVPRRRSSLNHQSPPTLQFRDEPRQLRHFHTFGDEAHAPVDDEPIILPRTVYRKPVPEPSMRAAEKPRHREALSASKSQGRPSTAHKAKKTFSEPLLSQFDSFESDCENIYPMDVGVDENVDDNENDANLFGDFAGAYNYDEGHDKIMMATVVPFSRQNTLSLRSLPSRHSLESLRDDAHNTPFPELYPMPRHHTLAHHYPDETSASLQSWIEHASRSQLELNQQYQQGAFYEEAEAEEAEEADEEMQIAEPAVRTPVVTAPQPEQTSLAFFFHQPGLVGIPLPREVVDTLRVSVSCFPETMLSLSSFSIQTIRTYSRKVRRRSQSDADSAHRLIMSNSPSAGTDPTPFVPPLLPPSPTDTFAGSLDLAGGVSRINRSSTSTTSTSNSQSTGRSFWKQLPKRLSQSRASSGLSLFHSRSSRNADSNSTPVDRPHHSVSGRRGSRIDSFFSTSPSSPTAGRDDDQSKNSGLCLKRIFPTASDNLCESLYAHIIAFNYISLLCPPPSAPTVAQKRQTIRIYVGSDVPLPESADIMSTGDAMSLGRITPMPMPMSRLENSIMDSPPSSPPPSRGGPSNVDDAHNGVYNLKPKAVMLLGLLDIFEPENAKMGNTAASPSMAASARLGGPTATSNNGHSNSLSRRYNSLRRRRLNNLSSLSASTYKPATLKKASNSAFEEDNGDDSDCDSITKIKDSLATAKKTIAVPAALIDAPTPSAMADAAAVAAAAAAAATETKTESPVPVVSQATSASAATDASMRDLHAGLHKCISQLVATMKLANGQLNTETDIARDMDPLFLRTLCELVRSQEEQR
ncbi:hypothetical protein F503_01156 [Ophiostoma piceae UAMH 11346]|uniref:Uncharacterized protein n=1 Tax=Ophiostoma piceae (strain UAMH 11346) TaxID=1262450 RepID=S3CP95_OPHP1|nr:hypothetical protein F503_01156 [Ophiostoma piceae UAMH 11346]